MGLVGDLCMLDIYTLVSGYKSENSKLHIFMYVSLFLADNITNQRTNGPENAHLKPDPGVLSHHEMT